jgi:hypothetical protein
VQLANVGPQDGKSMQSNRAEVAHGVSSAERTRDGPRRHGVPSDRFSRGEPHTVDVDPAAHAHQLCTRDHPVQAGPVDVSQQLRRGEEPADRQLDCHQVVHADSLIPAGPPPAVPCRRLWTVGRPARCLWTTAAAPGPWRTSPP